MRNLSSEQKSVAQTIVQVGRSVGASEKHIAAALATAWVESRWRNLNYGDRDSLGAFQQRPSMGWGAAAKVRDVAHAARSFYLGASTNKGVLKVNQTGTVGQLAQRVQRSGFPTRYDEALPVIFSLARQVSEEVAAIFKVVQKAGEVAKENPMTTGGTTAAVAIIVAVIIGKLLRG
jgi:hypothetical protein